MALNEQHLVWGGLEIGVQLLTHFLIALSVSARFVLRSVKASIYKKQIKVDL